MKLAERSRGAWGSQASGAPGWPRATRGAAAWAECAL